VSLRGRERTRRYGGDAVLDLGLVQVGEPRAVARPTITYGAQSRDTIRQKTAGVAYELRWLGFGEFGAGIQKTDYSKTTVDPAGPQPRLDDSPWLPNATAALYLGKSLVAYAGYTRGLEEAPGAPDIAVNRNDAPPAIRTKQIDGGLRWAVSKDFRLLAGVFDVEKPYFDLDAANRFDRLGTVRHRGVELSASGQPLKGLSLVAGTIFLDAEIDAPAVTAGTIGKVPVATTKRYSVLSLDYRIPDSPLSVDAVMESTGDRIANQANSFVVPPRAVLALGTRYRFNAGGKPALLRAQVSNIFGNYGYGVGGGGLFVYNLPRRFSLNLSADL
jgi:iron complex outermembrane receptor protein